MRTAVIIDDEPVIRGMVARHLANHGWRVLEADNGDDGLKLVLSHRPEAVLCDLLMPGTNGFQVCRLIRSKRDQLGEVLLIVTTGSNFPSDRKNALEAGADHYLLKPVSAQEIVNLLQNVKARDGSACAPLASTAAGQGESGADTAAAATAPVRVRFWGVRGEVPVPGPTTVRHGGNTPCVEIRAANQIIVLDAGTGLRALGRQLLAEHGERPIALTLLLTHTHWDHIQGLPFFAPLYGSHHSVTIVGYEGARQSLMKTLAAQMDSPYFPVPMHEIASSLRVREMRELEFLVGRVPVQATFVNHPGITLAYRISTAAGAIVYMPDHEILPFPRERPGSTSATADAGKPRDFVDYKNQLLAEFVDGAEVFVCDAQYDAAQYERHIGQGHSCVDDAVELARLAKAKQLVLFHHDPSHDDEAIDRLAAHARSLARGEFAVEAAREGAEIVLERRR